VKIEEIRIDEISNHERNPKQHPDKQIRLLEESIKRFGWTNPVILSADNIILAGHARVKAAIELGQDTIPCIRTKLSGAEADAYLLTDNRLSDIAPYDRDILAELLSDIPSDLAEITGFDQIQIDTLLSGEDIPDIDKFISDSQPEEPREEVDAEPQIDRAAELNEIWQVKTGDMWQLGDHRLICGDCTDPAVVERLKGNDPIWCLLTDPPYCSGGFQEAGKKSGSIGRRGHVMIANDMLSTRGYVSLIKSVLLTIKPEICYIFTDWRMWVTLFDCVESSGLGVRNMIVWDKGSPGLGRGWRSQHELALCGTRVSHAFDPHKAQGNVIQCKRTRNILHPTEKPSELFEKILMVTDMAYFIIDPFAGSGTTLIACENTGRKCRGVEISPDYCAVILQRFKDATGKEPVRING